MEEMMLNYSISLGKRQLVDSIWKSAGIEGLGTTFPNTEKILDNIPVETSRDEVLFIVNMKRAWEFLFDNIDYPNNLMFLRELNKICMTDIIYGAGIIRTGMVTIGGTSWTPELPNEAAIIEDPHYNPEKQPMFYSDRTTFIVTFPNLNYGMDLGIQGVTEKVTERVTEKVTEGEREVLELLKENPEYTYADLADRLSVSRKTVSERIKKLKEKNRIERIGSDTKGYWRIF